MVLTHAPENDSIISNWTAFFLNPPHKMYVGFVLLSARFVLHNEECIHNLRHRSFYKQQVQFLILSNKVWHDILNPDMKGFVVSSSRPMEVDVNPYPHLVNNNAEVMR